MTPEAAALPGPREARHGALQGAQRAPPPEAVGTRLRGASRGFILNVDEIDELCTR